MELRTNKKRDGLYTAIALAAMFLLLLVVSLVYIRFISKDEVIS